MIVIFQDFLFSNSTTKDSRLKKFFVINIFVSLIFPMIMGILTFFFGDVVKESNDLCYHTNLTYRVIVYIGFLIYYLFFFGLAWKVALRLKEEATNLNSSEATKKHNQSLSNVLLSYTAMIVINCLLYLGFVFLFITTMNNKEKFNLMNMILGHLIEPITIPLFLIFYGTDSLKSFLNQSESQVEEPNVNNNCLQEPIIPPNNS